MALKNARCKVTRINNDRARAQCPTHQDDRPSLGVSRRGNKVLLHCFAGCRTAEIVHRLGLRMADLFDHHGPVAESSKTVATYEYCDANGELVAQKVRKVPKAFRWRRPHQSEPNKWLWNLNGLQLGLYRLHELTDVRRVYCLEGEKAVDLFWTHGLPACCPPAGASQWLPEWSADLQRAGCTELIVLPDADKQGLEHAERIAAACVGLPSGPGVERIVVKVVSLPGLPEGADAFDWLQGGQAVGELLEIVSSASYWEPGAQERARAERRRARTRERVKRFRERDSMRRNRPSWAVTRKVS